MEKKPIALKLVPFFILLNLTSVLLQFQGNPPNCPTKCLCFSTTVRCMFSHLDHVPKVPATTTILDLRFNKIKAIPPDSFSDLRNLNTLLLNNNHITSLQNGAFSGLRNLRYLYLYKNRIRHIEPNAFRHLLKLEQLYLHYNELEILENSTFSNLASLKRLFLHNNRLRNIPRGTFRNLDSLKRLRLDSNALVCDCQLLWLAKMMKQAQKRTQVAATCESPTGFLGRSLASLTEDEFFCKGSPEIIEEPTDVKVSFGGTAYFSCKVEGEPEPEVTWLHNNEVISENHRYSILNDGTLMIENTENNDMGFYECHAQNTKGKAHSRKANFALPDVPDSVENEIASSRPRLILLPTDSNATVGSSVEIQCQSSGRPRTQVSWTKNNQPLILGNRTNITNEGKLRIVGVRIEDAGLYRCRVENNLGSISAAARLTVFDPPHFTAEPNDIYTSDGGTAILKCEAEGKPAPEISWFKEDIFLTPTARFRIEADGLHIEDVEKGDSGIYICRAHNEVGSIETEAALYITDKLAPVIKNEPRDTTVSEGSSVTIPCQAIGLPTPVVTWKRDGQTVAEGSKRRIEADGSLRLDEVSTDDVGIYECSVSNSVGYATARAVLSLTAEPITRLGDQFLVESFAEASEKVNRAVNDTVRNLFNDDPDRPRNAPELLRIFRFPKFEGRNIARIAETIEQTLDIVHRHVEAGMKFNISKFSYRDLLSPQKLRALADISGCLVHRKPVTSCSDMCFHLKYRTIDGSCNNLNHPMWGASLIAFRRSLPSAYENGFNTPIGWNKTGKYFGFFKPSARAVSTRLLSTDATSPDHHCTHMLMQWGQFLDHDIDHSLPAISTESFSTGIPCQRSCDNSAPCFPIDIPTDDPRIHTQRCMEFTRSSAVCGSGTTSVFFDTVLPREQINQLTSFIDASQMYTSSNPEMRSLRNLTFQNGELRVGIPSTFGSGKPLLPFSNGSPIDCRRDHTESAIDCFLAGDIRANEQVGLLAMHTLWFREHNRIASELRVLNPHWDSDMLFHEARKILGAMMQHITYVHWLPHILGPGAMGSFMGYKQNLDPTVSNVFATAAMRFGHTLINPVLYRLDSSFNEIKEGHLPLHKAFFSPWRIVEEGGIDPILRGLFAVPAKAKKDGQFLNSELTEKLFRAAHEVALDLAAMNIQRGRDHGLPDYRQWRRFCNLSIPESFDDLESDIRSKEVRTKLKQLYGHPGNVDLFVGGLLEDPVGDGRVGPTFSCLLLDQFRRLRDGDRFWYENAWVFKPEQLAQIRLSSLGRVLCDNGDDVQEVTQDVFVLPHQQSLVPCSDVPKVDLRFWADCCSECQKEEFSNLLPQSVGVSPFRARRSSTFSYFEDDHHPETLAYENEIFGNSRHSVNPTEKDSPQRRTDRFLSTPFESYFSSEDEFLLGESLSKDLPLTDDPLEGYVKDVTEERIEGVEALVEQLSKTIQDLSRKVRRLERLHKSGGGASGRVRFGQSGDDPLAIRNDVCKDDTGRIRRWGERWWKDKCVVCGCKLKGIKCRYRRCPPLSCANPTFLEDKCCPSC